MGHAMTTTSGAQDKNFAGDSPPLCSLVDRRSLLINAELDLMPSED